MMCVSAPHSTAWRHRVSPPASSFVEQHIPAPLCPVARITPAPTASVSEHKNAELSNLSTEELLLKENPGRFVLFPIQDTEVSEP
jgi:hypothetical protein